MADQEIKSGSQPEQKVAAQPEKKVDSKASVQPGSDQDFNQKVEEKTKQYEKKVEEMEKRYEQHGSIGKEKVEFISAVQINRLRHRAEQKKAEFQQLAADEKAKRFAVLLGETEQELEKLYFPYDKVVNYVRGLNKLDANELVKLEAIMDAMTELKTNPAGEKVFLKALNKEKLLPEDYKILINLINPVDLQKAVDGQNAAQIFEGSQAGAIIGVMPEADRFTLVELLLKEKPLDTACQIIESLLTAGHLSVLQIKQLCDQNKIPDPQKTFFLSQIDQGKVQEKQKEYFDKVDRLANINRGRTMENPLSKSFGAPALYGLSSLWGAMVALVNFKLHFDWDHPLESSAKAITDKYFLLGASALGVGVGGTASIVAPEKFGKAKEEFLDFWKGPQELKAKAEGNRAEIEQYLEIPLKQNPYLASFFMTVEEFPGGQKKSGLTLVKELIEEQKAQKKDVSFQFEEIMKKAGPKQQTFLQKAFAAEGSKDINLSEKMHVVMTCLTSLSFDTDEKFAQVNQQINRKQGINS